MQRGQLKLSHLLRPALPHGAPPSSLAAPSRTALLPFPTGNGNRESLSSGIREYIYGGLLCSDYDQGKVIHESWVMINAMICGGRTDMGVFFFIVVFLLSLSLGCYRRFSVYCF